MATAVKKALSLPAVQSAIKSRASSMATKRVKEEVSKVRAKLRASAPMIRRDVVEAQLIPAGVGAVGAVGFDLLFSKLGARIAGGARGDIIKTAVAIGSGFALSKVTKNPHVQHAALGAATVNVYKLLTRVGTRTAAGTLAGLMSESHDMDLAGYPELMPAALPMEPQYSSALAGSWSNPAPARSEIG